MIVERTNAFLSRFVGPNAAHVIDALIGLALVGAGSLAVSAPARVFLQHHATLTIVAGAAVPIVTALASKFRKAAGSSTSLADEIARAVTAALKEHAAKAATTAAKTTATVIAVMCAVAVFAGTALAGSPPRPYTSVEVSAYMSGWIDASTPIGWGVTASRCVRGSHAFVCLAVARNRAGGKRCFRAVVRPDGTFLLPIAESSCRSRSGPGA